MLQRAASNAYTWWWASHLRTKQSKWLGNNLQEMEDRVKAMIKLIGEDADSFAKKAEMYFRRRPELLSSVEEAYRAYRALADRYDRLSGELHKANHTIATAFPDQVPMIDDDDDPDPLHTMPPIDASKLPKPPPELPRLVSRNKRPDEQPAEPPKPQPRRSDLTPEQAQQEVDRLQRRILGLQTEKEFCKSSYQGGLKKYWDIERQMTEMQEEISRLQDEFSVEIAIEDDDARALMAATTIKSCEDSLVDMQEKQKRSAEEARLENERIQAAQCKLEALKGGEEVAGAATSTVEAAEEEVGGRLNHERFDLQSMCDKVKELIVTSSESSVAELVEKIEQLVEKVIGLEVIVSSQTALILTLRAETDELHKHLREVEDDKKSSNVDPDGLNQRLTRVEEQLQRILSLERCVKNESGVVRGQFVEACDSLNDLSDHLHSPRSKVEPPAQIADSKIEPPAQNEEPDKLTEMEKQIQELSRENAIKDEEIKQLRRKLFSSEGSAKKADQPEPDEEEVKICHVDLAQLMTPSPTEYRFRADIDKVLEENLDFWLRFSTSYHQIQKFSSAFKGLQEEAERVTASKAADDGDEPPSSTDEQAAGKSLREFNTGLQVWVEHNEVLQRELQSRFAALCSIQDEIARAAGDDDGAVLFTPYQAAKFQGEVINMQQENNKVAKELQTGLDHVKGLQAEVAKALSKLHESFEMSSGAKPPPYNQFRRFSTMSRVPLKTFLFAARPRKPSIFACMNPASHHRHHVPKVPH